jgi:type II secretory pathway pseudopilin PulG
MNGTEKIVLITALTAAIAAVVQAYIGNRITEDSRSIPVGPQQPNNSGSEWTNAGANPNLNMNPQSRVYQGPGNQQSNSSYNGQIFTKRFNPGGNHNAGGTGGREQSYAFQTWTKNPFANGNNTTYAGAVNSATQDPTNQVSSLVLGPGVAPND